MSTAYSYSYRSTQHVSFSEVRSDQLRSENNLTSTAAAASITSTSTSKSELVPLAPTKLVLSTSSASRRGVNWSLKNDFKVFDSSDSIIPSSPAPPPSIRSYIDSDSAYDTPSSSRTISSLPNSDPPSLVRSILKQKDHEIRIARSVEEGTLKNKEAARQLVIAKRPKLVLRDSFQLAMLKGAAGEEGKGMGRLIDDQPASDESNGSSASGSDDSGEGGLIDVNSSADDGAEDEEDAEGEEGADGPAADTAGLVEIILDGAEDLLTLEEAYLALTTRLRRVINLQTPAPLTESQQNAILACTQPIRDEAPAMVRAMQRDLHRLLGKVPNAEVGLGNEGSSPFRGLMPLQDGTPFRQRNRLTPSPTPNPLSINTKKSPDDAPRRQGYTEAEVRYRREASGVGAGVLRLLAFTFHTSHLYSCFSEGDLQTLLEQVLIIPRTPKLPTPNQKRTYFVSILILAQIRIPVNCIIPVKEKIVRSVESAINDTLGSAGTPLTGKEGPSQAKKEGFHAVANLVATYPSIFFPFYADLLPTCLRSLSSPLSVMRNKAAGAAASFASAKLRLLSETQSDALNQNAPTSREDWVKMKSIIQKSELFVVSHLSNPVKLITRSNSMYLGNAERKTEWTVLEQVLKDKIGDNNCVLWACATWSVIVTLIGTTYIASGLTAGLDHIMERSLMPTTNTVRPTLARMAWNHAIHAYLSPSATSISQEGRLVQTFRRLQVPPSPSSERLKSILLPVSEALRAARDPAAFALVFGSVKGDLQRGTWLRNEKPRRLQWMIISGLNAATVVYAYSGIALHHQDQPAKEVTAVTGLPSSDGASGNEQPDEEDKIAELDASWDSIVYPMLKQFSGICGVDELKKHGWQIIKAITSPTKTTTWDMDRLLCSRYINGEVFGIEKDSVPLEVIEHIVNEGIRPSDIPSWGSLWIVRRLGRLLQLFDENLQGIRGVAQLHNVKWTKVCNEPVYLPLALSHIWTNLVKALATAHTPNTPPTPLFVNGLQAITRQLVRIFERDPSTYVPVTLTTGDGEFVGQKDLLRIQIFSHLFGIAREVLGDSVIGGIRIPLGLTEKDPMDEAISSTALGKDTNEWTSVVGNLLGQVVRTRISDETVPRVAFRSMMDSLLDAGSVPNFSARLLGDLTNQLPWIFEENEEIQLTVWASLASKWAEVIDLQPSSATSTPTNHTGALLVNLLSGPFRGRQITSFWHQSASRGDLSTWQALLEAAILRSRARRVGSNLGVLESLAGHLGDFLDQAEKTSSTTITLSCLASAAAWISFVPSELHHSSHYSINENFVPVDFLSLVCNALLEAYPSQNSLGVHSSAGVISPAVGDLVESLRVVFQDLPGEFVMPVLEPLKAGLGVWLADEARLATTELGSALDKLYITILEAVSNSIAEKYTVPACSLLDDLLEIYAPRLSRALSPAVPAAFSHFWSQHFEDVLYSDLPSDVFDFVTGVKSAVPFLIRVHGLDFPVSSENVTPDDFPFSQSLREEESKKTAPLIAATSEANSANTEEEAVVIVEVTTADCAGDSTILPTHEDAETQAGELSPSQSNRLEADPQPLEGPPGNDIAAGQHPSERPQEPEDPVQVVDMVVAEAVQADMSVVADLAIVAESISPASPSFRPVDHHDAYDADISQALETQQRPLDNNVAEAKVILITGTAEEDVVQLVPGTSSPPFASTEPSEEGNASAPSPTATESSLLDQDVSSGNNVGEDVFGPAGMTNTRRRRAKRSRSTVGVEAQSLLVAKKPKRSVIPSTLSLPDCEIKKDEADGYDSDCIIVSESPPPVLRPKSQSRKNIQRKDKLRPVSPVEQPKRPSSFLSSAGQWLGRVKVPSFGSLPGFFSPSRSTFEAQEQDEQNPSPATTSTVGPGRNSQRSKRNAKKSDVQRESSQASSVAERKRLVPVVELASSQTQTKRRKTATSRSRSSSATNDEIIWDEEEKQADDELLLSPESAAQLRKEEEEEIARDAKRKPGKAVATVNESGIFDDAPNDPSPLASRARNMSYILPQTVAGPSKLETESLASSSASPVKRSAEQSRLLKHLDEAKSLIGAMDGMDIGDVTAILSDLETVRNAATMRLISQVDEVKKAKKKRK